MVFRANILLFGAIFCLLVSMIDSRYERSAAAKNRAMPSHLLVTEHSTDANSFESTQAVDADHPYHLRHGLRG